MKNFYSTKLISRSTSFSIPLGILLILLGVSSIVLSFVDVFNSRSTLLNSTGLSNSTNDTTIDTNFIQTSYAKQSMWPTFGKGIWIGIFHLVVGIFSLIAYREKTLISIRILSSFAFISVFLSIFLSLSSLALYQQYDVEDRTNANQKTSIEQKEVLLNALLVVCGVLSFIVSLILAICTLISGNFCQRQSDDFDTIDYSNQPTSTYSTKSYYS